MHLELRDITKRFGPIKANDCVTLSVQSGSIHAVLGENGAGKSTLMKILAGYLPRTSGEIRIDGRTVQYGTPAEAKHHGIGMLYQDPLDFPNLTVLENFMTGQMQGLRRAPQQYSKNLKTIAEQFGFTLHPDTPVAQLTVGERQQLELLRLLSAGVRLLILDEPTTGISSEQKTLLFNALKQLAADGKSVLLVSHKLEDVASLCDTVTVMKQGRISGKLRAPFDPSQALELMFDDVPCKPPPHTMAIGDIVLEMKKTSATGGRSGLLPCSAAFRTGEIVGLAGLEGSGQGLFLRIAAGLVAPETGSVQLDGVSMHGGGHRDHLAAGVAFLPGARLEEGLMPGLSITEHAALDDKSDTFFVNWSTAQMRARRAINDFQISGSPSTVVDALSGGNQQRLLLSLLPASPRLLLLENPTRGLDFESAMWVWEYLLDRNPGNCSIIFSSSELDEIRMVATRIMIFFDGRVIADVAADQVDGRFLAKAIAGRV